MQTEIKKARFNGTRNNKFQLHSSIKCDWCASSMKKISKVLVPLLPEPDEAQFSYDVLECVTCRWTAYDLDRAERVYLSPETLEKIKKVKEAV